MTEKNIELLNRPKTWYRRWWVKILFVLAGLLLVFLPFYFLAMYRVYGEIKSGTYIATEGLKEKAPFNMDNLIDPMSPFEGASDAKIQIVEFGDFNCSKCLAAFPIIRELMAKHHDQIRFSWRNYPVVQGSSLDFALAAVCAHKQNRFWALHDKLFQSQGSVTPGTLTDVAKKIGLDVVTFQSCLQNKMTQAQIKKDYYAAQEGAVKGTPTFFINGYKLQGVIPLESWEQIIKKFLTVYE